MYYHPYYYGGAAQFFGLTPPLVHLIVLGLIVALVVKAAKS